MFAQGLKTHPTLRSIHLPGCVNSQSNAKYFSQVPVLNLVSRCVEPIPVIGVHVEHVSAISHKSGGCCLARGLGGAKYENRLAGRVVSYDVRNLEGQVVVEHKVTFGMLRVPIDVVFQRNRSVF